VECPSRRLGSERAKLPNEVRLICEAILRSEVRPRHVSTHRRRLPDFGEASDTKKSLRRNSHGFEEAPLELTRREPELFRERLHRRTIGRVHEALDGLRNRKIAWERVTLLRKKELGKLRPPSC
jgi:hypothetical protein